MYLEYSRQVFGALQTGIWSTPGRYLEHSRQVLGALQAGTFQRNIMAKKLHINLTSKVIVLGLGPFWIHLTTFISYIIKAMSNQFKLVCLFGGV